MTADLRCAVIGAGYFGRNYIRLLQEMPDVLLSAVASRSNPPAKKNISDLPSQVRYCTDAREVFSDATIDCVVIATPASSHATLATAALEQGKHVLVEKPMAMSVQEAERITEAARKSGRIFMVGHQYLYNDYVRELKRMIDGGVLGGARYVIAERMSFGPIRSDVGCFWETAGHDLAIIEYLFSPGTVKKSHTILSDLAGSGRDDFASAGIVFESGLVAAMAVSWFAPEKTRRMTITGDKGMAVFDEMRPEQLRIFRHPYPAPADRSGGQSVFPKMDGEEMVTPVINAREPLRSQLEHFIACIRTGEEPVTGIEHGLRVTTAMESISHGA